MHIANVLGTTIMTCKLHDSTLLDPPPVQVEFGEEARIVGNIPELGSWDVFRAPKMRWNDGHVWSLELDLPTDGEIEFKVRA